MTFMESLVNVFNEFLIQPSEWLCDLVKVLKLIKAQPCPQQTNGVDYRLFAVAVSIHILKRLEV